MPVTLQTMPVDPYDLLSGYYVTLDYAVERPEVAPVGLEAGQRVWVRLEEAQPGWEAVSITADRPELADGQVVIRATWSGWRVQLEGVKRFYIPEAKRQEIDEAMREVAGRALVDMRVDESGTAALLRLRIGDAVYED